MFRKDPLKIITYFLLFSPLDGMSLTSQDTSALVCGLHTITH